MPESVDEIATLRIELRDTSPLIWRQLEIPTSLTLKVLHDTVQAAMGWFDGHLWEFTIGKVRYALSDVDDVALGAAKARDAGKTRLRDVLGPRRTAIDYIYDFGDGWEHRLIVADRRAGDPALAYPRFIAGEGACPPEDCGGLPGFYEFLAAIADPKHPGHADTREWYDDDYDPADIDEAQIKIALGRIAKANVPHRRGGRRKRSGRGRSGSSMSTPTPFLRI